MESAYVNENEMIKTGLENVLAEKNESKLNEQSKESELTE